MTDNSIRDAAFAYRERGWSVIPLITRDKAPKMRHWTSYQRGIASVSKVEDWFAAWPDSNIGIVTGAISGLVVLDVDPAEGGADALADLVARHGALPPTPEAETGGGGRHLYFRHPGGVVKNRSGLLRGVDLHGDGGYVVVSPSVHPSGRAYAWRDGRSPDDIGLAEMPSWLLEAAEVQAEGLDRGAGVPDGASEGERDKSVASLTGHLLWHGVDPQVTLELVYAWNQVCGRPPLPDDEVVETVESILRMHQAGRDVSDPTPPSEPPRRG